MEAPAKERPGVGPAATKVNEALLGYGIGAPGQVPPGPTSVSPCALCAGSALFETVITTHGFFFEPVRWQIVVFFAY